MWILAYVSAPRGPKSEGRTANSSLKVRLVVRKTVINYGEFRFQAVYSDIPSEANIVPVLQADPTIVKKFIFSARNSWPDAASPIILSLVPPDAPHGEDR
ncbi:hypothetical protein EVAR_86681_1 [Eumeta japonica]|uniref:Uncharacterized protein n=1 Tax=Eumeta variegata TaxID=151549 RepID=A0A4C1Y0A9_EUMVA|nr:hypothetical protein EVAR_86681_1 [Eumeta japonica]